MKVHKYYVDLFGLLLLYFAGIVCPAHNAVLVILVFLYAVKAYNWINNKSLAIVKTIVFFILFQNTLMGIGMHLFNVEGTSITIYSQVPTILIIISSFIAWAKGVKIKEYRLFYIYLIIIGFNYAISSNKSFVTLAYNVRNFIIFFLAYTIGKTVITDEKKIEDFIHFYIDIVIFSGVIGLIALCVGNKMYIAMGAAEVADVKALNNSAYLLDGLPGYFYGDFFGTYYWRMASLFLEPVNYSAFVSLAVVLRACHLKETKDMFQLVFLLFCNLMTFGKGGLLIDVACISALFFKYLIKLEKRLTRNIIMWGMIVGVSILGIYYGTHYTYNLHFYAIRITINALAKNPLGFGIGSVGNVNNNTATSSTLLGAETGLLNFACQIGVEGVVVFVALLVSMSNKAYKTYKLKRDNYSFIFSLIPIILCLVFIFQENIFTTQVVTGFMFIQGYYSNCNKCYENIKVKNTITYKYEDKKYV